MANGLVAGYARQCLSIAAVSLLGLDVQAQATASADALLAIDQQRTRVVERIVDAWGPTLAKSGASVSIDELRARLMSLRADRLFAATLAGTEEGLREVTGFAMARPLLTPLPNTKSLGDTAADVVYTPVTPCRLVETRGNFAAVYQGNGTASHTPVPFASNETRTYTVQGGNGVCLTQLPGGLTPSAVQLQVFGIPTTSLSGDIEILPQGSPFGSTATMVYVSTLQYNTVSTAAKVNTANKQISVQVRGGGAHLAIDVVGYFAAPNGNGGKYFRHGGNAFGTTAVLGTTDNQPVNINVNGERVARYEPSTFSPNVIGGHANNAAAVGMGDGNTIGGGGTSGNDCFEPSAGTNTRSCGNKVTGGFNTIGGGRANAATDEGTVAGGSSNTAGVESAVGGGFGNTASGRWAAIAGGANNSVPFGDFGTVAGGDSNTASSDHATVGGGSENSSTGGNSTVAGGALNTASGGASTVAGGISNTASGGGATVAGGSGNTASGQYSLAAGHRAKATTTGTFMWADSREFDFQPSVANFFGARATGGVGFTVAIDGSTGGVTQFCNLLPGNPSWQCTSDRNAKENFADVDGADVLARVVAMPISTWNFKGADPMMRAMGPTAQDFYAAFRLGNDDKSIATSNLASVALAAIQGLNELVRHKDATIGDQQREIADLRERMNSMRGELDMIKRELLQLTAQRSRL